ncbi:hypothetical protein DPMN_043044 [Dreissena polymorpha]|uniref:Uncharacterized protein n=1 Tax=Dreissena polymorpha TaxID=45954 RepID=A0A9D4D1W8_DREPO|nr:hypothetical protein DPMN_043044 [Dreissena polymorpha]
MAALKIDDANIEILAEQNREILVQDMGFPITDVKTALFELVQHDVDDIILRLDVMKERKQLENNLKETHVPLDPREPLLEENQRLNDMLMCHLCHNNPVNALFLPCTHHNRVNGLSYGKTHHVKKSLQLFKKGMPFFAINTKSKLGTGSVQYEGSVAERSTSGLRRWFKAPVSSEAWVQIPPLPHF